MIEILEIKHLNDMEGVTLPRHEYEELIRDSEKLRCIESVTRILKYNPDKDMILAICGYAEEEKQNE